MMRSIADQIIKILKYHIKVINKKYRQSTQLIIQSNEKNIMNTKKLKNIYLAFKLIKLKSV